MPTTYVGSSVFSQSITIPVDGDLADADSVNVSAKAEIDTQINLFESIGQLMQSTSPIVARSVSGTSIDIFPMPFIAVTEGGTWKTIFTATGDTLTSSNIEGGGPFLSDTWYYVYAYSVAGVCTFQISTTIPDSFLLYKNGTFSHKFINSFRTKGGGAIIPFQKYGNYVSYLEDLPIGGGSSLTESPINTSFYIPPTINSVPRLCKLAVDLNSNTSSSDTVLSVLSISGSSGYKIFVRASGLDTSFFDISTDTSRTVYYFVQDGSGPPTVSFKIMGYYE